MNESILSDPIKAEAISPAERERGEATRRSDPPSLRFGVASQIKAEAEDAGEKDGGGSPNPPRRRMGQEGDVGWASQFASRNPQFRRSDQIKAAAQSLRVEANPGNAGIPAGENDYGERSGRVPSATPTGPARTRPPSDPHESLPPSRAGAPRLRPNQVKRHFPQCSLL